MTTPRILALFLLLSTIVHAEDADSKNLEHAKMLQRLYPTPALQVVIRNEVSYQIYQEAVNDAYRAGVPSSILNECVATRAMLRADAASLRQLLPKLKENLASYRPETSVFPDKEAAEFVVKTIQKALDDEEQAPGSLAKRAKFSSDMGIARKIKAQLATVEALVDAQAIAKKLPPGTDVPESVWRSGATPGSRFATTNVDELGNEFGPQKTNQQPTVPKGSYERLKTVVPDSFWAPFGIPK